MTTHEESLRLYCTDVTDSDYAPETKEVVNFIDNCFFLCPDLQKRYGKYYGPDPDDIQDAIERVARIWSNADPEGEEWLFLSGLSYSLGEWKKDICHTNQVLAVADNT